METIHLHWYSVHLSETILIHSRPRYRQLSGIIYESVHQLRDLQATNASPSVIFVIPGTSVVFYIPCTS